MRGTHATEMLVAFLAGFLACGTAHAVREVRALKAEQTPVIDGRLDDPVWQRGEWYSTFTHLNEPDAVADVQTRFKVAFDEEAVFFAIHADEPNMDAIVATVDERDGKLWVDDCVEVFITPEPAGVGFYQFIVNSLGAVFDNEVRDETRAGGHAALLQAWDSEVEAGVTTHPDGWAVELRVRLAELGLTADCTKGWRINVGRERYAGVQELSTFSPLTGGFHQPELFAVLELPDVPLDRFLWRIQDPYDTKVRPAAEQHGFLCSATARITNDGGERKLVLVCPIVALDGERTVGADVVLDLAPGTGEEIPLAFSVSGEGQALVTLELRDAGPPEPLWAVQKSLVDIEYEPLAIDVLEPHYRNNIYATQSIREIRARVRVNLDLAEESGMQLIVAFDNRGELVQETLPVVSNEIAVALRIPELEAGRYDLVAVLLRDGHVLHLAKTTIRKLPPAPHEWRLDEQGVLLHNGERVVPFGWFSMSIEEFEKDDCPYNVTLDYNAYYFPVEKVRRDWDRVAAAGGFITTYPYAGPKMVSPASVWAEPLSDADADLLRARVRALKDHPALFAWYMADEPELRPASADRTRKIYEIVADEDPFHPCIMLNDTIPGVRKYADGGDVLMPDPYPCFLEGRHAAVPIEKVGEFIRACHGAGTGVKAIWVTPQAFNYGDYGKRNNRAPDFTELRNMTYQSALYGVTGFIYYTWSHSQNYMDLQVGMPYLAQEIADLEEAILAPAAEGVVRVVADVPEHLHSSARRVGEDVVILAVNTSTEAQRAAFEFAAGPPSELHVISENRVLAAGQDGAFADAFGPYATHLYTTDEALAARTTLAEAQAEIEARDLARRKPGNLAFEENGTVVTASSSARFSSSKDRVVDGVAGGMAWRDGTPNETPDWLEITWPGPVEIARVVVHSETIERVAVLVPNESGWGQVAEGSGADLAEISLVFPKVSTDRLRVEVRKNTAGAAIAIVTEIEAYSD